MKTTLELPEALFREAKALAASRGTTLKQLFTEALREKLESIAPSSPRVAEETSPWMAGFGKLGHLHDDHRHVSRLIEEEFETVDSSDIE